MASNSAAWLEGQSKPLVVKEAKTAPPEAHEVTVKNGAVAINPVDWKMQDMGFFIKEYPVILGCDVAGEIVEVGSDVKHLKKGQRVLAHPIGLATGKASDCAFQQFTNVPAVLTSPIPDEMKFSEATVLPLGTSTAAACLYQLETLNLNHPKIDPDKKNDVVLIWSGSSSVGTCAIQLAVASGYTVVTTCSKRNFDFCRSLGATHAINYKSETVVDDILSAIGNSKLAGCVDCYGEGDSLKILAEIATKANGSNNIATVLPGAEQNQPEGTHVKSVFAVAIKDDGVGEAVYKKFLPQALEKGVYKPKPDPTIVGKGLDHIQAGIDKSREGVSATKLVIEL